jgi:hypothetical protein
MTTLAFATLGAGLICGSGAQADCAVVPFSQSQPVVERFLFNKETLLRDFPRGGEDMRARVAVLAASSNAALPQLIAVARFGNTEQRAEMGAGLGIAARRCQTVLLSTTRSIEAAVKTFPDLTFTKQFALNFKSAQSLQAERDAEQRSRDLQNQSGPQSPVDEVHSNSLVPRATAPVPAIGGVPAMRPVSPMPGR